MSGRRPPNTWAWVRAALLSGVVLYHGLLALPMPRSVSPEELDRPEFREELRRWRPTLSALGITEEEGLAWVRWLGALESARDQLVRPGRRFLRLTGTGQGWALFAAPDPFPGRLELWAHRADGTEELLYRRHDPEARWMARVVEYRRVRGLYDGAGSKPRPVLRRFVRFLAEQAFQEDAARTGLELRVMRTHSLLPWEKPDPKERIRLSVLEERK